MSWIMKANILYDHSTDVYANGKLYVKIRKIRFKWEVMK